MKSHSILLQQLFYLDLSNVQQAFGIIHVNMLCKSNDNSILESFVSPICVIYESSEAEDRPDFEEELGSDDGEESEEKDDADTVSCCIVISCLLCWSCPIKTSALHAFLK